MHIDNTPHSNYHVLDPATPGSSTSLAEVSHEKDLAVWVTNKLESSLHSHMAAASANIILGTIRRTSKVCPRIFLCFCIEHM